VIFHCEFGVPHVTDHYVNTMISVWQ
jgi:hypothetical protein